MLQQMFVSTPKRTRQVFDRIYRTHEWGKGSGNGSDPAVAAEYIRYVEQFVRDHAIRTVLDCGCGDLRIASSVDWGDASYHGIDVSPIALGLAAEVQAPLTLEHASILERDWSCDLALVKDVFQHLSFADIRLGLKRLQGCKYILATNDVPGVPRDIANGGYRPVDLRNPPVNAKAEPVLEYGFKQVLLIRN